MALHRVSAFGADRERPGVLGPFTRLVSQGDGFFSLIPAPRIKSQGGGECELIRPSRMAPYCDVAAQTCGNGNAGVYFLRTISYRDRLGGLMALPGLVAYGNGSAGARTRDRTTASLIRVPRIPTNRDASR